jgi:hypothetical protein
MEGGQVRGEQGPGQHGPGEQGPGQHEAPEERFEDLVDELVGCPGVSPPSGGSGFGRSALRWEKKIFAMLVRRPAGREVPGGPGRRTGRGRRRCAVGCEQGHTDEGGAQPGPGVWAGLGAAGPRGARVRPGWTVVFVSAVVPSADLVSGHNHESSNALWRRQLTCCPAGNIRP